MKMKITYFHRPIVNLLWMLGPDNANLTFGTHWKHARNTRQALNCAQISAGLIIGQREYDKHE